VQVAVSKKDINPQELKGPLQDLPHAASAFPRPEKKKSTFSPARRSPLNPGCRAIDMAVFTNATELIADEGKSVFSIGGG
jgi:hypothetical protein